MITVPSEKSSDQRIVFKARRLVGAQGTVWTVDAKFNPDNKVLKVYRIEGDITKTKELHEACGAMVVKATGGRFTPAKIKRA